MSPRALTVCGEPGCPVLVESGRCDEHRRQRSRAASARRRAGGDPSATEYQTERWRKTRARYLQSHPTCTCGAPATEVDHVMPRRQLIASGFHNPDAEHLLQALCKPCHSRKTVALDGGFGRDARPIQER